MAIEKEWNKPAIATQSEYIIGCGEINTGEKGQYRHSAGEKDNMFQTETGPEIIIKAEKCICIRDDSGKVRYEKAGIEEEIK